MATFLLLLCIAAGAGVIGILFMLYGPTTSGFLRVRSAPPAYTGPAIGFTFAPPPPPAPYPVAAAEGSAPMAPGPIAPASEPFVPSNLGLSTDFSAEEPVRELRIRAKSPSPPPLPAVTPLPPPPPLPKAAQTIAPTPAIAPTPTQAIAPKRSEAPPPRLGVSAPTSRARHLEPPRRMPPPMPRTRAARGSDAPPPSFATDKQRTVPHEVDELATAEHTFVD